MIDVSKAFAIYGKRLRHFILSRVRREEEADDILQDVFMRLIVNSRENDITHLSAWLYRAARNRITDRSRKQSETTLDDLLDEGTQQLSELIADEGCCLDKELMRRIVWTQLNEALDELPPGQKLAFVRTELDGVSFNELSCETGVSIKTLLSRKHYAVRYLRSRLREIYDELIYDD
ncbi:MAG: sigma-70 family RNA polymerase sigma factor [Muribaculaceae bacterium]|nr:sigma-70 family RNA polymerase sigma factor [Muribaculaceae bacterium]